MDVRKYKKYLKEVGSVYGINPIETESLFKTAIARAYNTFGSAYIWEDGTITLTMAEHESISLKNYIVSVKQYAKIIKHFTILLEKYAYKRDTLFWAGKLKGSVISVKILEKSGDVYIVKPLLDIGGLDGYPFVLPLKKVFQKELIIGSATNVTCKGFSEKQKKVIVYQKDETVALLAFEESFRMALRALGKTYEYKDIRVDINSKTRSIVYSIDWQTRPSATVISFLNRELNEKFGRCSILHKEIRKKDSATA